MRNNNNSLYMNKIKMNKSNTNHNNDYNEIKENSEN